MNKNARLLVGLRWAAITFQLVILVASFLFKLPINTIFLLGSISIQVIVNVLTDLFLKEKRTFSELHLFFQLLFDLLALTIFVWVSGGLANPFSGLFLIQAFLAALLLSKRLTWLMIGLTSLSYAILLFFSNTTGEDHHRWMAFHLHGMVVNHIVTTVVIGFIVFKIISNIKEKEKQIQSQKSLLSAGAFSAQMAHKLGTPLSIVALLSEDLEPQNVLQQKEPILEQIFLCKSLLQRFFSRLSSLDSTQSRLSFEGAKDNFLSLIQERCPGLKVIWEFSYSKGLNPVSQELFFLLLEVFSENASEAKAAHQWIFTRFSTETFEIEIVNDGPDLPDDVRALMTLGITQNKDIPHAGMGLFLVRLILDSLNGDIRVYYHENKLHFVMGFSSESVYE